MTDPHGSVDYTYDALNRLVNESINGGVDACSGSSPSGITLGYDAAPNLTSYCDGAGSVTYGYNADNEVTSLAEAGAVRARRRSVRMVRGAMSRTPMTTGRRSPLSGSSGRSRPQRWSWQRPSLSQSLSASRLRRFRGEHGLK